VPVIGVACSTGLVQVIGVDVKICCYCNSEMEAEEDDHQHKLNHHLLSATMRLMRMSSILDDLKSAPFVKLTEVLL
jgi:hypothetical protein